MRSARQHSGFTLLELSITVVIISVIVGAMYPMGQHAIASAKRTSTNQSLDQLEAALMAFRVANNRLPCPADATLLESDVNFGVESVNGGACTTGSTYSAAGVRTVTASPGPTANYVDATNNVVEGAIPFKALNLPKTFMYDAWGRKFAYAVNYNVTASLAMASQSLNDQCNITVNDASGNTRDHDLYTRTPSTLYTPASALYALVSYGEDGHGGYTQSGTRYSAGVTNADEQTNCHCNASAVETTYAASYVMKDASLDASDAVNPFGDLVRSKDRWQMMTYDDTYKKGGKICTHGVRFDGATAGYEAGNAVAVGDVNGDGIPDLVIVEDYACGGGYIRVVFGSQYGFPNPLPLNALNGTNGFTIQFPSACGWTNPFTYAGYTSVIVADINGDGAGDIIFGQGSSNIFYLAAVFGHPNPWPATVTLSTTLGAAPLDGVHGFLIQPASMNAAGTSWTMAAGDLNGDGIDDLVFNAYSGGTYILWGHTGLWSNSLDPTTFTGSLASGGAIVTSANGVSSFAVGDVNGDGIADLAFAQSGKSAPGRSDKAGVIPVMFGYKGAWTNPNLDTLNGTNGYYIYASSSSKSGGTNYGPGPIAIGDVNGDGIGDIITGWVQAMYYGGHSQGSVFVTFGSSGRRSLINDIDAMVIAGTSVHIDSQYVNGGYHFPSGDGRGIQVIDLNGDGVGDIVVGDYQASTYGSVDVIFGHKGAWAADRNLNAVPLAGGTDGVRFDCSYAPGSAFSCGSGRALGLFATSASKPSTNFNNDDAGDLIIPMADITSASGLSQAGTVYVVYGHASPWPATVQLNTIK